MKAEALHFYLREIITVPQIILAKEDDQAQRKKHKKQEKKNKNKFIKKTINQLKESFPIVNKNLDYIIQISFTKADRRNQ